MSDYIEVYRRAEKAIRNKKTPKANNAGKFQVKKRAQYENEIIKCESKLQAIPISYGDRFIPRRYFRKQTSSLQSLHLTDENDNDIFSVKKQPFYWRLHNYRINIGMQLGLNESQRLLNFHDTITQEACNRSFNRNPTKIELKVPSKSAEELDWSCKPRAKPLAYNDSTHDMPGFDEYINGHNIIDWSSKGQIAASFDSSLVLWGPPSQSDKETSTVLYELKNVKALKYSPAGDQLALSVNGITSSLLQIWDISDKMSIFTKRACMILKEYPTEAIRCIEWEPTCKHIICGMSTGTVFVVSYPELQTIHRYDGHKATISNIKYSVHNTFIAITDLAGNLSILRNNSHFELNLKDKNAHYIAWHPWIEMNLLIGYKSPASIHLLDLRTKTTIAHYRRNDSQYTLCAMAINPLSAELVVSFSHQVNNVTHGDILVMASMNRIVDNISAHQDAVYYILWDPTGTKVATAGQDESLNIWHFFGKSQKKANELTKIHDNVKMPKHSKLSLENAFMRFR